MKKMICGISIFFGGWIGVLAILITSIYKPWSYNGITGLRGFLLGSDMMFPFTILIIMTLVGAGILFFEAYLKK